MKNSVTELFIQMQGLVLEATEIPVGSRVADNRVGGIRLIGSRGRESSAGDQRQQQKLEQASEERHDA